MTIEIRQLVIRAVADARAQSEGGGGGGEGEHDEHAGAGEAGPAPHGDALVARCVREVLRELRKSRER